MAVHLELGSSYSVRTRNAFLILSSEIAKAIKAADTIALSVLVYWFPTGLGASSLVPESQRLVQACHQLHRW